MNIGRFWAGTEESLQEHVAHLVALSKGAYTYDKPEAEQGGSRLISVQGSVGVLTISGSLTNGRSGYSTYSTTYSEIREAMVQLAADAQVKTILLDVKSGGGSVLGLSDTAELIRRVDTKVKPVHAFTDAVMASAAYWLGSSARKVYATSMAEVGSVGVIAVHQEYSKLMADIGITPTVIRAGEFKALGHPMEKLSEKGKETIQASLDYMYDIFASYVADRRGMAMEGFKKTAGEGRVFVGQQGVDIGLVDSITTFDALMSKLEASNAAKPAPASFGQFRQAEAAPQGAEADKGPFVAAFSEVLAGMGLDFSAGSSKSESISTKGTEMPIPRTALTDQHIAAMAEGSGVAVTGEAVTEQPAAPEAEAPAAAAPAAPVAAAASAAPDTNPLVTFLQAELAKSQAQVISLSVDLKAAQDKNEAIEKVAPSLRAIAQASVDRMKVALSMPAGLPAASDEALLAEHVALRSKFEANFKPGGVAAVSTEAPAQSDAGTGVSSVTHQARIQATRLK